MPSYVVQPYECASVSECIMIRKITSREGSRVYICALSLSLSVAVTAESRQHGAHGGQHSQGLGLLESDADGLRVAVRW